MVSRSQIQQDESTILHSSGASNSSGSTTAVATPTEPPSGSKSPLQLLRRSRNTVGAKMKLSNLFRSIKKSNTEGNDPTTLVANLTNDLNGNDNTTISSVIVTMDTTVEEKHREMSNTTVWMESLYHSEIPVNNDDDTNNMVEDNVAERGTTSDIVIRTNHEDSNVQTGNSTGTGLHSEEDRNEILQPPPPPPSTTTTTTSGALFCSAPVGVPFFDRMCHIGRTGSEDSDAIVSDNHIKSNFHNTLPDDPSIQESFECFFMAQQESMLKERQQSQQQQQPHVVETVHTVTNNNPKLPDRSAVDNDDRYEHSNHIQTPPSMIHQSLLKNRSISRLPIQFQRDVISRSPRSSLPQQQQPPEVTSTNMFQQRVPPPGDDNNNLSNTSRMHMNDESKIRNSTASISTHHGTTGTSVPNNTNSTAFASNSSCICCHRQLPLLEPEHWPQRPLLLRPTPNSGTRIRGIRFVSSSKEYLWRADQVGSDSLTWPQALRKHWEKDTDASKLPPPTPTSPNQKNTTMCSQCMILPINNGKELPGESLVSDFESELFIGTILVRLKDCHGTTIPNQIREQVNGYFHNLHRRYQVVIRGQFKQSLPWTECITGFQLERPCGKLPPKWIVNGALNVVRFFAPQLQTSVTGPRPYSLTPLGSTPQSLIVHDMDTDDTTDEMSLTDRMKCDLTMEVPQEEPRIDTNTLIGHASNASSSMQRARYRKKHFDKMYADARHHHNTSSKSLQSEGTSLNTDPTKIYTFEFLQHLLSFDDFTIELGSIVGSVHLQSILHGQPLQIMSSYQNPIPLSSSGVETKKPKHDSRTNSKTSSSSLSVSDSNPNALLQNRFWCFDIWHEMLYADAKAYDEAQQAQNGKSQHTMSPSPQEQSSHDDDGNLFCQSST